jgi:hypothetical protein
MDATDEPGDATERMRARLAAKPIALTPPPRRGVLPWLLVAILLTFALGLIANPWFERSIRSQIPGFAVEDTRSVDPAVVAALDARLRALETRPAQAVMAPVAPDPLANERVAALEARLDGSERVGDAVTARIDNLTGSVAALAGRVDANAGQTVLTLQAARVDADRAQGALSVLAARRALEAGRWSPGLATPLRNLFGTVQGPAVEAVVALGSAPVTPVTLRRDLGRLRGTAPAADASWWGRFTTGLASVVEVRERSDARADDPLARADAALAAGDVMGAVATVERLPRGPGVTAWLASARRWQAGWRALAGLEEAALTLRPVAALPTLPTP